MQITTINNVLIRHNEIKQRDSIWFLHAFGDSGLIYQEAFDSKLADHCNLYVIDFPGFGASPLNLDHTSIKSHAELLVQIINGQTAQNQKVNLVAHSIAGLIGTRICQVLDDQINYFFNVEGNLTEADSYFSSKPLQYETADAFYESFKTEIFELAQKEERFKRYYANLRFAKPEGMRNWSVSSQEFVKDNRCGHEFVVLSCQKLYIWGTKDTPQSTQEFIKQHNLPNRMYDGVGHWHMHENAEVFYRDVYKILTENKDAND